LYRVDEGRQHATSADQMRQSGMKCAENSQCEVDVASTGTAVNTSNNGSSTTVPEKRLVKIGVSDDVGEKEFEYTSSAKIGSSFVADSLGPQSVESNFIVLNQLDSAKQMQVKSGGADVDCQSKISDDECLLKHTSQQPVDSAEREHQTKLDVVPSALTHDSNMVSIITKCLQLGELVSSLQNSSTISCCKYFTHIPSELYMNTY